MKSALFIALVGFCLSFQAFATEEFKGGRGDGSRNGKTGYYEFNDSKFVWYVAGELMAKGTYFTQGK